jgi:hypothetical protein
MSFLNFIIESVGLDNWMSKRSVEYLEDFLKKHPDIPLDKHQKISNMIIAKRKAIKEKTLKDHPEQYKSWIWRG